MGQELKADFCNLKKQKDFFKAHFLGEFTNSSSFLSFGNIRKQFLFIYWTEMFRSAWTQCNTARHIYNNDIRTNIKLIRTDIFQLHQIFIVQNPEVNSHLCKLIVVIWKVDKDSYILELTVYSLDI